MNAKKSIRFCKKHRLYSRCEIDWRWTHPMKDESFTLVRRLLKLFPFEYLSVEVDQERSRDIFSDWDSYLEWLKSDTISPERLFSRIKIARHKKVLGLLVWEGDKTSGATNLVIYTEQSQALPIRRACETLSPIEIGLSTSFFRSGLLAFLIPRLRGGPPRRDRPRFHNQLFGRWVPQDLY